MGPKKPHVLYHKNNNITPGPNSYNIPDSFTNTTKFSFSKSNRLIQKNENKKQYNYNNNKYVTISPSEYGRRKFEPNYYDTFHDSKKNYSFGKSKRIEYEKKERIKINQNELERPDYGDNQVYEKTPQYSFAKPKSKPIRPKSAFDTDRWPVINSYSPGPEHCNFEDWTKPKLGHNRYGTMGLSTRDDDKLMYFK